MKDANFLVLIAGSAAVYTVVAIRLKLAAQPLRLRLAREGEEVLQDARLNERQRRFVRYLLNSAFGLRIGIFLLFFIVPKIVVSLLFTKDVMGPTSVAIIQNEDTRQKYESVKLLHAQITVCNHPLPSLLLLVWFGVWYMLLLIVRALVGSIPPLDSERLAIESADSVSSLSKRLHLSYK